MEIYIDDLFNLASGSNADGQPNNASSLMLVRENKGKEIEVTKNIFLEAPVRIFSSRGAVVCTFDFTISEISLFMNAYHFCLNWLNEEEEDFLYLYMLPVPLKGKVSLILGHLIYADAYEFKNGIRRLILVFDNIHTMFRIEEDVDYEELEREIEAELKAEERTLEEEIFELEKELAGINEELSGFHYEFDPLSVQETVEEEETSPEPGVRFIKEEGDREDEI